MGTWNSDGLIIIPDNLSDVQSAYVQDLICSGYPVIATTAERPWPLVAIDNAGGIRQALTHLFEHGHRRIAFIVRQHRRRRRQRRALAGVSAWPARGWGCHRSVPDRVWRPVLYRRHRGHAAHPRDAYVPFSALLASNDQSCLGAIKVLREAGLRVPEDVAVIGFDDSLEARSHLPPLTTVRHPAFALGYQAVLAVLDRVAGQQTAAPQERISTRLIIRQSCGCQPASAQPLADTPADRGISAATLAQGYGRSYAGRDTL